MDVNNKDSWIEVHDPMKFKSSLVRLYVPLPHYGLLFMILFTFRHLLRLLLTTQELRYDESLQISDIN